MGSTRADATAAIACKDLRKVYATGLVALNDVTLTIERGMSFGLLGENGAGKSTLAIVLFSFSPVFPLPGIVLDVLSISRIPLWPLMACYTISVTGSITWEGVLGLILAGGYVVGMNWIAAGYWLKGHEFLLH